MKYEVTYTVTTEYIVEVEADTEELAQDHADTLIGNCHEARVGTEMDFIETKEWKIVPLDLLDEEEEN
jgi:hypothetical protein